MIAHAKKRAEQLLGFDFIRFGIVGSIGFVVSEIFIYAVHGKLALAKWLALVIGNEAGLLTTFIFHETWTYKNANHRHKNLIRKLIHFHMSAWSGVAIIISIGLFGTHVFGINIYVSQAIGSAVAMIWNYFWTKYFIFKGNTPKVLLDPEAIIDSNLRGD